MGNYCVNECVRLSTMRVRYNCVDVCLSMKTLNTMRKMKVSRARARLAALSFASRDPMTVAPGGLAIFLGRLTPPPIMWPRLRNVKRGTLFVLAARTDPSIMTLLLCKNRSFNFQRPMLDQTHPHTHIPYQTRFQACVFSNGASGRLSQQSILDMAVSGQEVATWEKVVTFAHTL